MAVLIDYIWQSTFCLLFFFGVYFVFLRDEKAFKLTRFYILITPLLAMSFPLINIPVSFYKPDISLEQSQLFRAWTVHTMPEDVVATFGLPEVTVQSTKLPLLWDLQDYFLFLYFSIVILLTLRAFLHLLQLKMLWEKGWYETVYNLKDNYFLIPTYGLAPFFSFFNKLFWDDSQVLSHEEKEQIIKHEIEHIKQFHSWDVMYYQVLSIIFWFNPAIHLMRGSLIDVHEFQADQKVITSIPNKETYPKLIVKIAFKGLDLPIGNYFIRSTTLKRILMIKNNKTINWFKIAMIVPLTAMLMALVSMKTEHVASSTIGSKSTNIHILKSQLIGSRDSLEVGIKVKKIKSPQHYEYIGELQNGKVIANLGELQYEFTGISSSEEYVKVRGLIKILKKNNELKRYYSEAKWSEEVDIPANQIMGINNWKEMLLSKISLPKYELELGLGGEIVVEFIISKEGKITNPIIKKSYGGGLDEQMLVALTDPLLPQWIPAQIQGHPVPMIMSTSFNFVSKTNLTPASDAYALYNVANTISYAVKSNKSNTAYGEPIFDRAQHAPKFVGGFDGWYDYMAKTISYPPTAIDEKIEGTVYVAFIINKYGEIENPELLHGIGAGCDEEAMRVISSMPNWYPGEIDGQKVNVRMTLPVRFILSSNSELKSKVTDAINPLPPSTTFKNRFLEKIKYPTGAQNAKEKGTVIVLLDIDRNGYITKSRIKQSLSPDFDNEVLRVLKEVPKWNDSINRNNTTVELPITFQLADRHGVLNQTRVHEIVVKHYGMDLVDS